MSKKTSSSLNVSKIIADSADEMINNEAHGTNSTDDDAEFERLLNEFINNEIKDIDVEPEIRVAETKEFTASKKPHISEISSPDSLISNLYDEERALYGAFVNFSNAINMMSEQEMHPIPNYQVYPDLLYPRYKPRVSKFFVNDTVTGWDIMLQIYGSRLANLHAGASDDDILNFAERIDDDILQLALISYVEILIEIESCEIAYEGRRIKAKKRKLEREIIEEHTARQEKIKKYIKLVEDKQFPINAERLVVNYFKTSRKDPEGAYQILTNSPATYTPIEVSKIPSRFFGMIKSKPEDGIKINKEIGQFMKKLKA